MAAGYITRAAKDSANELINVRFRSADTNNPSAPAAAVNHLDPEQLAELTAALESSRTLLVSIQQTLQAQAGLAVSLWTDNTGAFFVRRDVIDQDSGSVVVSWTNPLGQAATPGAGVRAAANEESLAAQEAHFHAHSAGAGYQVGDVIVRQVILDLNTSPAQVVATTWVNLSSGAVIAAPTGAHLTLASKDVTVAASALPLGAATELTAEAIKVAVESAAASLVELLNDGEPASTAEEGGLTYSSNAGDASEDVVSAVPATLTGYWFYNPHASDDITFHLYDAADVATVTVGTTPAKLSWTIGPKKAANLAVQVAFASGIVVSATKGVSDAVEPTADGQLNLFYRI